MLAFTVVDAYAVVSTQVQGAQTVAKVCDYNYINLDEIKNTRNATKYEIDNSTIYINNFSDWQDWNAVVEFGTKVHLDIKNLSSKNNGEKLNLVTAEDEVKVTVKDTDNLYKINFRAAGNDLFLNLVRETDYKKVFKDGRGVFLENIRSSNPDNKMLYAMDRAATISGINSVMNSAYHFNPIILMNPVKTINRAELLNLLSPINAGAGAEVDYIFSDKTNNYAGHFYIANEHKDLAFKVKLNFNSFSYRDDFNDFDGTSYGIDVRAKQYVKNFWFDGIFGINRSVFDADSIYMNGNAINDPKGMSEYARLSTGYDYKNFNDFVFSPFVGVLYQRVSVAELSDKDTNLNAGLMGRYNFTIDGIRYEYAMSVAIDEKAKLNLETNIGFVSVFDNAGTYVVAGAFRDDFGVNYKLSVNAKISF